MENREPVVSDRKPAGRRCGRWIFSYVDEWTAARMRLTGAAGRADMRRVLGEIRDTYNRHNREATGSYGAALNEAVDYVRGTQRKPLIAGVAVLVRSEREDAEIQIVAAYYGEGDPRNTQVPDEEDRDSKAVVRGPWAERSAPLPMAARDLSGPCDLSGPQDAVFGDLLR